MRTVVLVGALVALSLSTSFASAQEIGASSLGSPVQAPSNALELKVGAGYTQGFGRTAPTRTLPEVGGAGGAIGAEIDYRINPKWSVGVESQYYDLANSENTSARGLVGNLGATYHFLPSQFGDPFARLGTGYRFLWENEPNGVTNTTVLRHGFELAALKVGYDVRLTEDFALAPVVGADLNMFLWEKATGTNGGALASSEWGTFVYAGFQGRFDIGGTRGERLYYMPPEPEPVYPTAATIPTPPPEPTTPVSPSVSVSQDILRKCQLTIGSIEKAPKFEFDKSELLPADVEVLTQIAECFKTGPMKDENMDLIGRADPRGTTAYNDALGMRRAKSIEKFFVSAGLENWRIGTMSRGERDAVGRDETTWAIDRRVDVLTRPAL